MSATWPEPRKLSLPARIGAAGNEIASIDLSVHIAGEGPAVVFCHGFPELAYSWRYQVAPLVEAGFQVILPDQRGYGGSDSPATISDFDVEHLSADMVGILDVLGIERAVFVGHDWGGIVAWAMPQLYLERTAGVIGVNTPYMAFPSTAMLKLAFPDPEKMYMLWFQQPGVAEGVLDANVREVFEKLMRRMGRAEVAAIAENRDPGDFNPFRRFGELEPVGAPLMSDEDLGVFVDAFAKASFRGGINWYRNLDRNCDLFPEFAEPKLDLPCLMITAECDLALQPAFADGMPEKCSDLEMHMIEDCGHWTQQEKPEELNEKLVDWLGRKHR
jgi:pimeloyl-ACP methyl ester carboxylesterase